MKDVFDADLAQGTHILDLAYNPNLILKLGTNVSNSKNQSFSISIFVFKK